MSETPDFSLVTALFGGSFDPLHLGHLRLAQGCLDACPEIEQVVFVPCFVSPFKSSTKAPATERLRLLRVGLEGTPFRIWDFEVRREVPSYTVDTLREAVRLGAARERLRWLVGADSYAGLPKWKDSAEIRGHCRIVIGNRPGHAIRKLHPDDQLIEILPTAVASQEIRAALAQNRLPPSTLPPSLEKEFQRLFLNSSNAYAK